MSPSTNLYGLMLEKVRSIMGYPVIVTLVASRKDDAKFLEVDVSSVAEDGKLTDEQVYVLLKHAVRALEMKMGRS
jgi:hypothetical protein